MDSSDMAEYMKTRRKERREALIWLGGSRCIRCSSKEDLELDHIDYSNKSFGLSGCGLDQSWNTIYLEFLKCQILCKNCHTLKTIKEDKRTGGGHNKILNPKHGTWAMYTNFKCRCDECSLWRKNYRNKIVDAQNKLIAR